MKYRKRPIIVEARQLTTKNWGELQDWINANGGCAHLGSGDISVLIRTLEGLLRADLGDWIIRGVKGEFYPCKPDVFAATYELVE